MLNIITPVPLARWGLDIVGPFPPASRGKMLACGYGLLYELGQSGSNANDKLVRKM